jgi:DNA invertase Pin-like site-specific DNA recombinase
LSYIRAIGWKEKEEQAAMPRKHHATDAHTRCAIYSRVSTDAQTTENQERELREIAQRVGWAIVKVYRDEGISGAKGRDDRPAFDALCRDASRRRFDTVMAWSVDRLGPVYRTS